MLNITHYCHTDTDAMEYNIDGLKQLLKQAYETYKKDWIKKNISDTEASATMAMYENDNGIPKNMSFDEYVQINGFADGTCYLDFEHWLIDTFAKAETPSKKEEWFDKYPNCPYYKRVLVEPDPMGHDVYESYCTESGERKEIIPRCHCKKCLNNVKKVKVIRKDKRKCR